MEVSKITGAPVLESEIVEQLVSLGGGIFAEVLGIFERETPPMVSGIPAALASGDKTVAQQLAHKLAGSAGVIGARRLQEIASKVEKSLKQGAQPETADLAALQPEYDAAAVALRNAAG